MGKGGKRVENWGNSPCQVLPRRFWTRFAQNVLFGRIADIIASPFTTSPLAFFDLVVADRCLEMSVCLAKFKNKPTPFTATMTTHIAMNIPFAKPAAENTKKRDTWRPPLPQICYSYAYDYKIDDEIALPNLTSTSTTSLRATRRDENEHESAHGWIHFTMTDQPEHKTGYSYEARRKRWLRIKASLPPNLRDRIALRNVVAVARLTPQQQRTLAEALDMGLKRVPMALRHLKEHPTASAQDLLRASLGTRNLQHHMGDQADDHETCHTPSSSQFSANTPAHMDALVSLIQECYPDMTIPAVKALASSDALGDIANIQRALWQATKSAHFNTDFVFVLYFRLIEQIRERLYQIIEDSPAYLRALRQAGIDPFAQYPLSQQDETTGGNQ